MSKFPVSRIRNICFCGHGSSGKTTLAEAILFASGVATRLGKVSDGTSQMDYAEDERARKYSINLSIAHVEWNDVLIHIVDTPGYPDFAGETISGLSAVETAAVLIDTSAGIKVNTRRAWEMSKKRGLGRLVVISKIDLKPDAFAPLVKQIQESFGNECVPLVVPHGGSVVNLLGGSDIPEELAEVKQTLVDQIIESNDALMEKYLEGAQFSDQELVPALSDAVAAGSVVPVVAIAA